MGLLLFLVFGLVIGLVARALMLGNQEMGLLMTIGLGVAGSFLGGILVSLVTQHEINQLHSAGVVGSLVGALVVLGAAKFFNRRRVSA